MTHHLRTDLTVYLEFVNEEAIRIRGHRIGIEHVLRYYLDGYTADEIAQELPGLALEKVYATITYYLANRRQVDTYLARPQARDEEAYQKWLAHPSPLIERLRASRVASLDEM